MILSLLILLPIAAWFWARRQHPTHLWCITGVAFGAVIGPFCLGLYATFSVSPLGLISGLIGLTAGLLHGAPGYEIATTIGLVESRTVVEGSDHLWILGVNAVVWGIVYSALGWAVDRRCARRN